MIEDTIALSDGMNHSSHLDLISSPAHYNRVEMYPVKNKEDFVLTSHTSLMTREIDAHAAQEIETAVREEAKERPSEAFLTFMIHLDKINSQPQWARRRDVGKIRGETYYSKYYKQEKLLLTAPPFEQIPRNCC